jgi:flagellar hook-associated protein 2
MVSAIDTSSIEYLLQSYRSLEERPIVRIETLKSSINNRISLFSSLKNKLKTLESIAKDLSYTSSLSTFGAKASQVSNESYFTVTTESSAIVTSHSVTVSQLAKAHQIVSNQYNLEDTTLFSTLGTGTHSFQVTVNGEAYQVDVDISAEENNEAILNKIVSAVNNTSDIEIAASIVKDTESTGRIVLTSKTTGVDSAMTLSDLSGSLLSTMGLNDSTEMNGTSGGYVYSSAQLNAIVIVDGITIERNSNTIEDAIEGLTLTLKKTHEAEDTPVNLNVSNDVEHIKSKIQEFIDAYNEVFSFIQTNTTVDTSNYSRSTFSGDFAVGRLKMQLRNLLSQPITGLEEDAPTIFANIGITTDRSGKLSISDSEKLDDFLKGNLENVADLFNSTDGFANRLTTFLEDYTGGEGILEKRKDVLQSQINQYNQRISSMEKTVDRKMEYYRQQFSQLQTAYAMYAAQSSSLESILGSGFFYY